MKLVHAIGAVVAAGVVAAACGSSGGGASSNGIANDSATQILTTAVNALKSASSVSVSGTKITNGKPTTLNGSFFANGDADASVTLNGSPVHLVKVGSNDYINAPSSYWAASGVPSVDLAAVSNVWVKIPDSVIHAGSQLSLAGLASHLDKNLGTLSKGSSSNVDGEAVIAVISSTQGTLYVATAGTPYPVEVVGKPGSANGGTLNFSHWNTATPPTVPAGAKTIGQLGLGGAGASGATGPTGAPS